MENVSKKNSLNVFEELNKINVNDHVEIKEGNNGKKLSYLSWAWAWGELKKRYPDAQYKIWRNPENNAPYYFDSNLGYMVSTSLTINGETYEMWLPVMDNKNKAMKDRPYSYKTKIGPNYVAEASMYDINTAIMRCLVKNIAMFGLGLYIYAGEDLPVQSDEIINEESLHEETKKKEVENGVLEKIGASLEKLGSDLNMVANYYHYSSWNEMTVDEAKEAYRKKCAALQNQKNQVMLA